MKEEFLKLTKYMAEHGELMKAYLYLQNPPAIFEEEVDEYLSEIKKQLDDMKQLQDKGTLDGQFRAGFIVPDPEKMVAFVKLRERLMKLGIKKIVDVGCYSGWMGRALSLVGIKVHGIDVHPVVIQTAALYGTGTQAVYEYLPVQKLGAAHPNEFEGAALFDVLEHCFEPKLVLDNVNRAVKKGGWVFINLPHPETESESMSAPLEEHEHLYSFSEKKIKELIPNATIEKIKNEHGVINWFIQYQNI